MDVPFNVLVNVLASSWGMPGRFRVPLLRKAGLNISRDIHLRGGFKVRNTRDVTIEDGCYINAELLIDGFDSVRIETGAAFGVRVTILTTTHTIAGPECRASAELVHLPVVIGRGAWIGAGAMIFPGVTVGAGSVVGAGAVVREDVSPNTVVAGNPARFVRQIEDEPL